MNSPIFIHHKEADSAAGWNFVTQRNIASLVNADSLTLSCAKNKI
jgi:hypothetical protein